MRVVNFTDARNNLKSVIDDVVNDADFTVIARRDAPDAVVMSLDTFNSIMETASEIPSKCRVVSAWRRASSQRRNRSARADR